MPMRPIKSIGDMMGGAVSERFNATLKTVLENIADPNTDATRKRKITLELTVAPSKDRATADFSMNVKAALAPLSPINQTVMINRDDLGNITATEIGGEIPGQMDIDDIDPPALRVVNFNSAR